MSLPEGTQLTEGKQYIFSNGVLTEVTVELSETTEVVEDEVKEEETEMASDTTETTEEVVEETETEMAEETPTEEAPALTEEKVASMIDEKMAEVVNMLAKLNAALEGKEMEVEEEEESAPVQLSAIERLTKFSKSFKK